ncbi:hypothetical protein KC717_00625 [Candidatus Dojkabacteria bacterium]|uniref:Uncharacterized protein n=1 Tax=Candidatus Dojkabacteria bacterium TaxID=2099670 RepID=A0A955L7A8_9BACT|nr:hypothetical protein [Candidatus Dojkabacteria bacterium]
MPASVKKLSKDSIFKIAIILYILGSLVYIGYQQWQNFQRNVVAEATRQGQTAALNSVLQLASGCNAFTVEANGTRVQLVNISCLQGAPTDTTEQPTESETPAPPVNEEPAQ